MSQDATTPAAAQHLEEHRPWLANLAMLVVTLSLGAWMLLGEPATVSSQRLNPAGKKVFPFFKPVEIVGVELLRGEGLSERVAMRRPVSGVTNEPNRPTQGWKLVVPVEDRADDAQVNALLNAVQRLQYSSVVPEGQRKAYPFGEPQVAANFHREAEAPFAFTLGEAKPGAVVPLRNELDGAIYHVPASLAEELTRALWLLRDRQLMAIPKEEVTRVVIEQASGGVGPTLGPAKTELVLQAGRWRVGGADGDHAARPLVEALLEAVSYFRASGIAKDAAGQGDLSAFGLAPPLARIRLETAGGAKVASLEVGGEVDAAAQERFVRSPARPQTVYQGVATKLLPLLDRRPDDYLHPGLVPFAGGAVSISRLEANFADGEGVAFKRVENDWLFDDPDSVQLARNKQVGALVEDILELKVRGRLGPAADAAKLGLAEPELTLLLQQGEAVVHLEVGALKEGADGSVHYVRRSEPGGGQTFYYTADLGTLALRLRDAPLELRHPTLLKVSGFDVTRVELKDETGQTTFAAELVDKTKGEAPNPKMEWQVVGDKRGTDDLRFKGWLKTFEDLTVDRWLAPDDPEARRSYGLKHPRRLTFTVRSLDDEGQVELAERTLLLGERIGQRVHALLEGAPAIGLIDAGFLDRLARGFTAQEELFGFEWYDVKGLKIEREGELVADFGKASPQANWIRAGVGIVDAPLDLEAVFKEFREVGLTRTETATEDRLLARGLKPPAWRLTFTIRTAAGAGPDATHVLLVGNGEGLGERTRWATAPGRPDLGVWYEGPLRALERYLDDHPAPPK
jgi:hypothetical protein